MKVLSLWALLLVTSCPTWAQNIVRATVPIAQATITPETPGEAPEIETPEPEQEAPGFTVKGAIAGQNGIYTVTSEGQSFHAYVDMTTNGGYWVLALYWTNPLVPAPTMKDLAVINNPLVTWSANSGSYPVIPSGLTNTAKEGMLVSGNASWTSTYGAWQSFSIAPGSRVVSASSPIEVTTPGGQVSLYLTYNGWFTSTTFGESGFGLFASPNANGPCGGAGRAGPNKMCPGYQGPGSGSHMDMTSEKFYYLKGR